MQRDPEEGVEEVAPSCYRLNQVKLREIASACFLSVLAGLKRGQKEMNSHSEVEKREMSAACTTRGGPTGPLGVQVQQQIY